jgi:hypothetical protein
LQHVNNFPVSEAPALAIAIYFATVCTTFFHTVQELAAATHAAKAALEAKLIEASRAAAAHQLAAASDVGVVSKQQAELNRLAAAHEEYKVRCSHTLTLTRSLPLTTSCFMCPHNDEGLAKHSLAHP